MRFKRFLNWFVILVSLGSFLVPVRVAQAESSQPAPANAVSAYDLILAMNTLRVAYGHPALIEDPIVDAVAQSTAEIMAANEMSWHIGDVRGRLAAAGYGGGATVWATENFAVGNNMAIDEIMAVWSDPDHMLPAVTAAYCNIGAGMAVSPNGSTYYILQAAYVAGQSCGSTSSASAGTTPQVGSGTGSSSGYVSQFIAPVKIATPDAEGKIYHIVQAGQSFWSIAIAYQIRIADLEKWNNLSRNTPLKTGQKLFIPGKNTAGYATPTPVGMIALSPADADGRIVHIVEPYQTLSTIAAAYHVTVNRILALNGLQADWPLQVRQKLLISPGNITPSPTLSPIQKLTPASDGQYYHAVKSGETLMWIANLYDVSLESLLAWNGLNTASIIRPNQKLLLLVTPPATPTPTPAPPTIMPLPSPTLTEAPPTANPQPTETTAPAGSFSSNQSLGLFILAIAAVIGGAFWYGISRQKGR